MRRVSDRGPDFEWPRAGTLGDALDAQGRPLSYEDPPWTVLTACRITQIFCGLSAAMYGFFTVVLIVADDLYIQLLNIWIAQEDLIGEFSADDVYVVLVTIGGVLTVWCVIECMLAAVAKRRSRVARVLLVMMVCADVAYHWVAADYIEAPTGAYMVMRMVGSLLSVAVAIMLFSPRANRWYARRAQS